MSTDVVATSPTPSRDREAERVPQVPVAGVIPFVAASNEHVEPAFDFTTPAIVAGAQYGPFEIPAYGFMRSILIQVDTTVAGALGGGALAADYPFNLFDEITLLDVNGAPIFGPMTGYNTFLANLLGGYSYITDPRAEEAYSGTIVATTFFLRIPVEISHHNARGAIANQNAAASFKVRLRTAPLTSLVVGGAPTGPTVRVRGYLEAWYQPTPADLAGRPQATVPPNHGTTQFWSESQRVIAAGANTVPVTRVGNLLRTLIVVSRAAGARVANALLPDPITLNWDSRQLLNETMRIRRHQTSQALPTVNGATGALTVPTGVYCYSFDRMNGGKIGDGNPALWLPTVQATRLEWTAANWAAGTVEVLTNDVAPVEIDPTMRYAHASATGFDTQA